MHSHTYTGTDFSHTISSAQAIAAGLFPPAQHELRRHMKWYPLPIHTIPREVDSILLGGRPCERQKLAYDDYHRSKSYRRELNQFKELFEYLEQNSGERMQTFENVARLHDALSIEKQNNKTYIFNYFRIADKKSSR